MTWSDARIAQLTRLWTEGVSATEIAERLGEVSRSGVLGKLYRLQLLGSRKPASDPRRYDGPRPSVAAGAERPERAAAPPVATQRAAAPEPPKSPWREAVFAPLAGTTPRAWLSREFGECAFPVAGEGDRLVSCCAATNPRSAYCAAHHRIVFKPSAATEQRRWSQAAERWAA
jgi:GcrA cell cycle regulator